jgi:nitrogen fixation protein FixH
MANIDTDAYPEHGEQRKVTGRMVLLCLVSFFALVAGANAILVRAAVSTFGGVEMDNAYQAGLSFAREGVEAAAQDALHWQVDTHVQQVPGQTLVEVVARDAAGVLLTGLTARARLVHPADKRLDRTVELARTGGGRFEGQSMPATGQWTLEIELGRDGTRVFRSRNRINLR